MVRFITILLLTTFTWVNTPIAQLLKVYTLIEHYYEHKSENKRLSILNFLDMHYAHDTDNHPGHERDMQLPFKQCSPVSFVLVFIEQFKYEVQQKPEYLSISTQLSLYNSPYHASEKLSKIWQPPRA